jgi:hypothetical protein
MASVQDIRDLLSRYVDGKISASELANCFAPVLDAALKSGDNSVRQFALAVHAQISFHFNGLICEAEMRSSLESIAGSANQGIGSIIQMEIVPLQPLPPERVTSNPGYSAVVSDDLHFVTS